VTSHHANAPNTPADDIRLCRDDGIVGRRHELTATSAWFDPPTHPTRPIRAGTGFTVCSANCDDLTIVTVTGDLDLATAPLLSAELSSTTEGQTRPRVVIDLTDVAFLACVGMAVLVKAHRAISPVGAFGVVAAGRATNLPLRLVDLDRTLAIYPDLPTATVAMTRHRP
jgi:anti-anti-sigma factor